MASVDQRVVEEGKHALYAKFIPELVHQLVGDDGAAGGNRLEAVEVASAPTLARVLHSLAQRLPDQFGDELSCGLAFAPCQFLRGRQGYGVPWSWNVALSTPTCGCHAYCPTAPSTPGD